MVQDRAIIYSGRPIVYGLAVDLRHFQWPWTTSNEHLYSPRMVEEIKEEKNLEHQTNKQWYGLTILTILTTVYNSVTITNKDV